MTSTKPRIVITTTGLLPFGAEPRDTHRIIDTLETARDHLNALLAAAEAGTGQLLDVWPPALLEKGGTIELPDGTMIEVAERRS